MPWGILGVTWNQGFFSRESNHKSESVDVT